MIRFLKSITPDKSDVLLFSGIALLAYGIAKIYLPAAFITAGVLFIGMGLLNAMPSKAN